jgi:DNA-binding NarL/FixJ family response regulator
MPDRHATDRAATPAGGCPVQLTLPVVLDAIRHPVMRRWSDELLAAEPGCWTVAQPEAGEMLVDAIARTEPDVVVVDTVDFPACCLAALDALPPGHVVVIGPEPDPAYRSAALAQGAAAWVSRDHVGDELAAAVRTALGCPYEVCPEEMALPTRSRGGSTSSATSTATSTGGLSR